MKGSRVPASRLELKPESGHAGRVSGRHGSAPVAPLSSGSGNLYSSRVSEAAAAGMSSHSSGGSHRPAASGYPNAWAARKGWQWQSKQSVLYQKDVDVSKHSETENGLHPQGNDDKIYGRMNAVRNSINSCRWQIGNSKLQSSFSVPSEASERPKLKLLPRTKPLDNLESPFIDASQRQQRPSESVIDHAGIGNDSYGYVNTSKPGSAGSENGNQTVDRPKLNLKPRSQPNEQLEGNFEKERNALFGGARPRELVLKEKGIDDSSHEPGQHPDRVKHNFPRSEKVAEQPAACHGEGVGNPPVQKTGRKSERNHSVHNGRVDMQRRNWLNENRQNERETERQQQQQQKRQPSPETWRKPAEQPKPVSPEGAGMRYGKAASALELAQAFSNQKKEDRHGGQRVLPGHAQMPFSRLMDPTPRPQINGY
ncbi:mastermind-like protein 3 [Hibiscus syriacus]|uniref:mastermind-like protein 3 n=1 Tax=Hibiscus syriacus TaxID=106335 RepID=UPI0019214B35|nr:mastermind-like protein 3 [Hibiscus syriacus]